MSNKILLKRGATPPPSNTLSTGELGFNTSNNTIYVGDTAGASKLVGAPLPLGIEYGGTGNATGLAASATKLATARTIRTNLASTSTASFNGTANITPGVTGTLPVANGGTGQTNAVMAGQALTKDAVLAPEAISSGWGTFGHAADSNYRGVLTLSNPLNSSGDSQGNAIKMYANTSSGGEIDVYEGTGGSVLAALFASTQGNGVLKLGDGTNSYYLTPDSIQKANQAISITKIWEYSHTLGSGFAAQTLYFSDTYDAYIVVGTNDSDNDGRMATFAFAERSYYYLAWMDSYASEYYTRMFYANTDRITFAAGANGSSSSIYKCQPIRVYGVKGVT